MPTKGRFSKGPTGKVKRTKMMFAAVPFPEKAMDKLASSGFFNEKNLEILAMCDDHFLKRALQDLASDTTGMGKFIARIHGNAKMARPPQTEMQMLETCKDSDFAAGIRKIREMPIRMSALHNIIQRRVGQKLRGKPAASKVIKIFNQAMASQIKKENFFFEFRRVLTPEEKKQHLLEMSIAEEEMYSQLQGIMSS